MNNLCITAAAMMFCCLLSRTCGGATSSLANVWRDTVFKASLNKMLVIAVRKDAAKRRIWEDAFTGELAKRGMAATSSYGLFQDMPPDTSQVIAAVQAKGFDGILVILRLPTETSARSVQGDASAQDMRFGSYWQRYGAYFRDVERRGFIDSQTVDCRAIDVTSTGNGGRLIWSATSRTPDPGSVMDAQSAVAGLVISELAKQNIIGFKK